MKALFSPFSPFVRECLVSGMELVTLRPSSAHPVHRDHKIIAFNPLGKVPTSFTDDGQVLYDSRVICEHLNDLAQSSLLPSTDRARWETLTLQSLGDGILDAAVQARYEDAGRPEDLRWNDWKAAQLDKVETSLASLEAVPQQLSNRVDLGSIAVGCALWCLDLHFAHLGWRDRYPQVVTWHGAYSQRTAMAPSWSLD